MQEQRTYWNRVGYLKIQMDDGTIRQFGGEGEMFDMKFDGLKFGDFYSTFTCSILGLTREHINALTVWDKGQALQKKRYIEVYAGYSSNGDDMSKPIFAGYVMNAIPTSPPEMWMNFECIMAWDKDQCVTGVETMRDASPRKILQKIAEILEVDFNRTSLMSSTIKWDDEKYTFVFAGKKKVQLTYDFAHQFNCICIDQNGTIVAADRREWLKSPKRIAREVSQDTGMLAVGNVDIAGAKVVHRLDNTFSLLSWVNVQSRLIPKMDSRPYYVRAFRHTGHLRGDKWQTELELIRQGANV